MFAFLTVTAFVLFVAALVYICNGLVLSILWGWFVVPLFGAPPLSIVEAIGVALVVGMITHKTQNSKDTRDAADKFGSLVGELFYPFLVLLIGWIVQLFL